MAQAGAGCDARYREGVRSPDTLALVGGAGTATIRS